MVHFTSGTVTPVHWDCKKEVTVIDMDSVIKGGALWGTELTLKCPCGKTAVMELSLLANSIEVGDSIDNFGFMEYEHRARKCLFRHIHDRILDVCSFDPRDAGVRLNTRCKHCTHFDGWVTISDDNGSITAHGDVNIEIQASVTPHGLQDHTQ